ncbi:ShlB/FhaC/HecB family hemolysin secretion/activation protein [Testudinibacter sp. P80/BLE/0925]|uniref:ShlB/FhaC/HecB family hemolysin secretion/activation protein n=1 Tax=Testudinibacter sp. TW-1 TaxID=3417757 RepID=UPI003D367F10
MLFAFKKKKKSPWLTYSVLLLGLPLSFAAQAVNEHEQQLRESERAIQQKIEENRYQQLSPHSPSGITSEEIPLSEACLPLNGLQLSGISLLKEQDLAGLSPIPADCISDSNVNRLIREITQRYLDKGYITARAVFAPLDENNTLRLHWVEGVLEAIESEDHTIALDYLFPNLIGKPLNIRDLDQGLDQLNRLQSHHATLDILPATQFGGSIVRLRNQTKSPYRVTLSLDNYASRQHGRLQGQLGFSIDNLTGRADFLALSYGQPLTKKAENNNRTYSALYLIPYGYWTASLFASQAESATRLPLSGARYQGASRQLGFRLDRVLNRHQTHIITLSSGLSHKRSQSELLGYRHPDQNLRLSIAELNLDYLKLIGEHTINVNIGVQRGLGIFGATKATSEHLTEPHFNKWSLNVNWHYPINTLRFHHQIVAQYSPQRLPSVETLELTGRNSVRGFDSFSFSGDSGWLLRNNISYPIHYRTLQLSPYAGLDTGRLFNRHGNNAWQSAVGTSFGIHLRYKQLSGSFSFDRGWFVSSPVRQNESRMLGKITLSF